MSELNDLYRELIIDHSKRPRNFARLADPKRTAQGYNPLCGDRITLMLGLDESGVVDEVAFTGRGCAISQASASILSDELVGKSVAEAAELTWHDMMDLLGVEVGPARLKCALLALRGLKMALTEAGVPVTSYVDEDEA